MKSISALISVLFIWIDQYTKNVIIEMHNASESMDIIPNPFIGITYVENRGAAFGIFQGGRVFFIATTIIILIGMIYYYFKLPKTRLYNWFRIALTSIFAGAIGNFIDRFKMGHVTDFIYFKFIDFPVFNFADIFVVIGTALMCILMLFIKEPQK